LLITHGHIPPSQDEKEFTVMNEIAPIIPFSAPGFDDQCLHWRFEQAAARGRFRPSFAKQAWHLTARLIFPPILPMTSGYASQVNCSLHRRRLSSQQSCRHQFKVRPQGILHFEPGRFA
jgi:hypothetical protein